MKTPPVRHRMAPPLFLALAASSLALAQPTDDGYRGIWYSNQPSKDEYRYKYSGGFATYPQQQLPVAVYAKEVNKTFFCYGGRSREKNELLHMVGYFDHATGQVPRPTILLNKRTDDAHDNPTLMLDDTGHVWIFSAAHGTARPSWIHRGTRPWSVDEFEEILETNFSYTHPWWMPGQGFLFLHTRYRSGRGLFWKELVYLKDLNFDAAGRPVILFLTATGYESGPKHGLRPWFTLHWTGRDWQRRVFTTSDHNYDHGSLYIEPDGTWRIIAPTDPGPQPWTTGGEMVLWTSRDEGATWDRRKPFTHGSPFNHTYARRPVNAHPGFYALWADGNPLEPSESRLYFTDRDGSHVWRLPERIERDFAKPEIAW